MISIAFLFASTFLFAQKTLSALRVSTFSFDETQKSANVVIGSSCAFTLIGEKDYSAIIFACSFSSHQALIKIRGQLAVLHQHTMFVQTQKSVVIFANRSYRVTIIGKDIESGVMTVTEIKTGKRWRQVVKGECGV